MEGRTDSLIKALHNFVDIYHQLRQGFALSPEEDNRVAPEDHP
jgi:hypothetical protein